jgi:hypothetical protein
MSNSDKCKHKTSSAKAEVIKKLDKSEELINFVKEYGVGCATIYDMRKNREKIECFEQNTDRGPSDRQTLNIELMNKTSQYIFMYVK